MPGYLNHGVGERRAVRHALEERPALALGASEHLLDELPFVRPIDEEEVAQRLADVKYMSSAGTNRGCAKTYRRRLFGCRSNTNPRTIGSPSERTSMS
jgi:hypothetical protein